MSNVDTKEVNFLDTEEHVSLVEAVKPFITVQNGEVNFDEAKAVEAGLNVLGTNVKDIRGVHKKVTAFNNAVRRVFGEKAIEDMAANKGVDEISLTYHVGQEKVAMTSHRELEARNPKTGEPIVSYGNTQIRRSIKGSTKQNVSIAEHLKSIGAKKLS